MLKDKLTLVIHSCDKFSDLWDAHVQLLNEKWKDRDIDTFLVTDKPTSRSYKDVKIVSAGEGTELSERLAAVLPLIKTEYILFTLDDYFPIYPVSTSKIYDLVSAMEKENLQYVRLFKRPNSNERINGYKDLYRIDLNSKKDRNYQVNLYAGIWTKEFAQHTARGKLNAWSYELSLTKIAREMQVNCAMSKGHEFEILDVVRKGQLLHRAARYLKKHQLYDGPRMIISWKAEWRINILTFFKDHFPQTIIDYGKGVLRHVGQRFYSDEM